MSGKIVRAHACCGTSSGPPSAADFHTHTHTYIHSCVPSSIHTYPARNARASLLSMICFIWGLLLAGAAYQISLINFNVALRSLVRHNLNAYRCLHFLGIIIIASVSWRSHRAHKHTHIKTHSNTCLYKYSFALELLLCFTQLFSEFTYTLSLSLALSI